MFKIRGLFIAIDGKIDVNNASNKSCYINSMLNQFSTFLTEDENKNYVKEDLKECEPRNKFIS
jgi:hypothetical protein